MTEWQSEALCLEVGPDLFFSPDHDEPADETERRSQAAEAGHQTAAARRVCSACPVWRECRIQGLSEGYGVFGGMTANERQTLRHDLDLTAPGGESGAERHAVTLDDIRAETTKRWGIARGDLSALVWAWPALRGQKFLRDFATRVANKRLGASDE